MRVTVKAHVQLLYGRPITNYTSTGATRESGAGLLELSNVRVIRVNVNVYFLPEALRLAYVHS